MDLIAKPVHGDRIDCRTSMYPTQLGVFQRSGRIGDSVSTQFCVVLHGRARFEIAGLVAEAVSGGFFVACGEIDLDVNGTVVAMTRFGYRGPSRAGALEDHGRLIFIDGCTDTILVEPPRLGDPVLNHLHIPPGVSQAVHAHPSLRIGCVVRGTGLARGTSRKDGSSWELALSAGCVFSVDANEDHAFETGVGDASRLDIVVFHPDSDWGPTDAQHPMRNRSYVRH